MSYTGRYIGTHVGGGVADETVTVPSIVPGVTFTGHTAGALGGGQVGCNLQFGGNWVIGIEGEGSAADIKGTTTQTIVGITGTASAKTDWIASATARLGYTWDRWLIYGKGGAAWAHNNYSLSIPVFPEHETASDTRTGWTAGGGIEWAFWNNWSVKAEYNYYDFGTSSVTLVGTFAGVPIEVPGVEIRHGFQSVNLGSIIASEGIQACSKSAWAWSKVAALPSVHPLGCCRDRSRKPSPTDLREWHAGPDRDRADAHVTIIDVPAFVRGIERAASA